MEYYKVYCSTHPYEFVSNFCADRKHLSTQLNASSDSVQLASVTILNLICKEELLPNTKTSKIHIIVTTKG